MEEGLELLNTVFIYGINKCDLNGLLPINNEVPQIQYFLRHLTNHPRGFRTAKLKLPNS